MTNLYGRVPHPVTGKPGIPFMINSGTFWRCRHGHTQLGRPCWRCGLFHPLRWFEHMVMCLAGKFR